MCNCHSQPRIGTSGSRVDPHCRIPSTSPWTTPRPRPDCSNLLRHAPTPVLQDAIHLTLDRFPETLRLQLGVGGMGLECPEGTLIRTGGQLHRLVSATDLTGGWLVPFV